MTTVVTVPGVVRVIVTGCPSTTVGVAMVCGLLVVVVVVDVTSGAGAGGGGAETMCEAGAEAQPVRKTRARKAVMEGAVAEEAETLALAGGVSTQTVDKFIP